MNRRNTFLASAFLCGFGELGCLLTYCACRMGPSGNENVIFIFLVPIVSIMMFLIFLAAVANIIE